MTKPHRQAKNTYEFFVLQACHKRVLVVQLKNTYEFFLYVSKFSLNFKNILQSKL